MPARRRRPCLILSALLATAGVRPLAAQLRPLDPMDWEAFAPGQVVRAQLGGDLLAGQRASVGGIEGRVLEAPATILSWTTGPVVLRAIVHPRRFFWTDTAYAAPLPGTTVNQSRTRVDAGDNALETVVRLAPAAATSGRLLALRWGVRLSTHNDRKGLDRHKTDFYALLGGRARAGAWSLSGEAGLGVYGARPTEAEKALPFVYALGARRRFGGLEPSLDLVGQATPSAPRGNESLAELRGGVRIGRARWLDASVVRGLARYSPRAGLIVYAGLALPGGRDALDRPRRAR